MHSMLTACVWLCSRYLVKPPTSAQCADVSRVVSYHVALAAHHYQHSLAAAASKIQESMALSHWEGSYGKVNV